MKHGQWGKNKKEELREEKKIKPKKKNPEIIQAELDEELPGQNGKVKRNISEEDGKYGPLEETEDQTDERI